MCVGDGGIGYLCWEFVEREEGEFFLFESLNFIFVIGGRDVGVGFSLLMDN